MRTPNPPTGLSLSQICRPRPPTATAGFYNQKLTHLRSLIDQPLLLEARPQPSITYRSLRDSYKADRDTNAQNSAGTNQFSTIGHSSYGNCLSDADRRPPRGWAMRWASPTVSCSQPARWGAAALVKQIGSYSDSCCLGGERQLWPLEASWPGLSRP